MVVVASLLYCGDDFGKSICLAVQTGFDTDCNAATVGSVMGMKNGVGCIASEWTEPLNGELETSISGIGKIKIRELVDMAMEQMDRE